MLSSSLTIMPVSPPDLISSAAFFDRFFGIVAYNYVCAVRQKAFFCFRTSVCKFIGKCKAVGSFHPRHTEIEGRLETLFVYDAVCTCVKVVVFAVQLRKIYCMSLVLLLFVPFAEAVSIPAILKSIVTVSAYPSHIALPSISRSAIGTFLVL